MKKKTVFIIAGIFAAVMIALWAAVFIQFSKNFKSTADINEITEMQTETVLESEVEVTSDETNENFDFNKDVPDEVWEELLQKTDLSEEEFSKEMKKYENLKDSQSYSWDNSEAPLTDEQLEEIKAEQESILASLYEYETTTEEASEITTEEAAKTADEPAVEHAEEQTDTVIN